MKKLFTLAAFVFCLTGKAQTYAAIPDSNFVHYLKTIVATAFKGDSLDTSSTLVTTATHTIVCNNRSIADMTGVTYFKSLKYLDCSNNPSSSLTFHLPPLPDSLTYLNCNGVFTMQSLPALPTSLKYLYCYACGISSLPALPDSLIEMNCGFDFLVTLPPLPAKLTYLAITNNVIFTTLPALPASLKILLCDTNDIESLPTLPASLYFLSCNTNSLTNLPILPAPLQYLDCKGNTRLVSLPILPNSLTHLDCTDDSLIALPVLPNALTYLSCFNNHISCFPTFPNSLTYINLVSNPNNCLPNYVLPAMASYTATPLCGPGNPQGCPDVVSGIQKVSGGNIPVDYYPNPANTELTVEASQADTYEIDLLDVNGKLILSQKMNVKTKIDLSNIDQGVYFLRIKSDQEILNKKIIISR